MKTSSKVRLLLLVAVGLAVVLLARPVMLQVMLFQETQKAQTVLPPPEKTISLDPAQAMGIFPGSGNSSTSIEIEN